MAVRITSHAVQRAKERGIPRSALTKVARIARRDGNYAISKGYAVVVNDCIVTVISSEMKPDSRLPIYQ